jgi:hypothetical protein
MAASRSALLSPRHTSTLEPERRLSGRKSVEVVVVVVVAMAVAVMAVVAEEVAAAVVVETAMVIMVHWF